MKSAILSVIFLVALCSAQNPKGNLELKQAYDAALIRMISTGAYDAVFQADTGNPAPYYYGDCAVASASTIDITYAWPTPTAGGVLDKMLTTGVLHVGSPSVSSGAYTFNTTTGQPTGLPYNLLRAIFDSIATHYSVTIDFSFSSTSNSTKLLQGLESGEYDIAYGNLSPGSSYLISPRNNVGFWPTCATQVAQNVLFYYSTVGSLYTSFANFKHEAKIANPAWNILVLANVAGTKAKAAANFPNSTLVTCATVSDCEAQLVSDDTIAGLYGVFSFNDSDVYSLNDPQLVPISALIRRDPCASVKPSSAASTIYASSFVVFLLACLMAFWN